MEKQDIRELTLAISKLSFEEKTQVYKSCFSLGNLSSEELNDKLVLISLVALVYQKMQLKDKNITPLAILLKIMNQPKDGSAAYQFLESLAIMVEDLTYNVKKIDSCGLTTSQDIINKIKELVNTWLPF